MKKIIALIVLAGIAAAAALPWINGMVMENLFTKAVTRVNQMYEDTGADIRFELTDYHRGYRHTRAQWKVDLGSFESIYGIKEIWFTERASHGWQGITSETSLEKNAWYAGWVKEALGGKDPLTIRTRFSVFDPIITKVCLESFTLESRENPLDIGSAEVTLTMDRSFEKVAVKASWRGAADNEQNRLGQLSFESEMEKVAGLVWQGRVKSALETAVDAAGGLDISDLVFTAKVAADKAAGQMDISMLARAGNISVDGESLSRWSLGLGIGKMDMEAYENLCRFYSEVAGRIAPVVSDPNMSRQTRDRILRGLMVENRMELIAQFEKMLKKGFTLEISPLDMTLPQGRVQGHFSLGLLRDMTLAGFFPVLGQPDLLLNIFSLDSEISMPGEFLGMQPNLTVPLFKGMDTGLFVLKEGRLHHRAETRDRVLYLNGGVVDLSI